MRAARKFHKHSDGLTRHFGINKGYRSPQLGLGSRSSVPECASLNRHEMLDPLHGLAGAGAGQTVLIAGRLMLITVSVRLQHSGACLS